MTHLLKFYRNSALNETDNRNRLLELQQTVEEARIVSLETELCFYVVSRKECTNLTAEELNRLRWILSVAFHEEDLSRDSFLDQRVRDKTILIEIGPRLNFSTAFSTNAVSICHSIGLCDIERIETCIRYLLYTDLTGHISKDVEDKIVDMLHDRMTQTRYLEPIKSFDLNILPQPWHEVDILGDGKEALVKVNEELGLAMDQWDLEYYTNMFKNNLRRNPTSVECFDLAQSNSEHSRHWFFKGKLVVDGQELNQSLFDMVVETQKFSNSNNVIKFGDNSSAIEGFEVSILMPTIPFEGNYFKVVNGKRHIIFTAETHNFPTGVAPFSGATTGTGGRIRDVQAAGRGAHVIAGTAGYSFGNLRIPGYDLPWEEKDFEYPSNFASPVKIAIEASNGASDYGNKFGEPVLAGFARSFGVRLPNGERREWVKPIMFSGGIGSIDAAQIKKQPAIKGMEVVKIGGPVYRIGVGGGSASSVQVQGDNKEELDFGAVQRGDAEMEQKLNRVIRACLELGSANPICSIHDQGAGGNGNVLKEICEPAGAIIYNKKFQLGDPTISTLECWGAEYQESNAILIQPKDRTTLNLICKREKCPVDYVGTITGNGKIVLVEGEASLGEDDVSEDKEVRHPVDLDLQFVLGKMPQKIFQLDRKEPVLKPLILPNNITVQVALERVLRLPSVASKRYLTNKVDRSVTGLVAQQQCVGPLHTPLADVAVIALSYFEDVGGATSIGEQPIKGLLDAAVGARMSVAEAITNLMFAYITTLQDVKCSGNWMWAAKLPGEGAALYDACKAMSTVMSELGIAVDGGKDSLSMAARVKDETVKAPGTLVISAYAPCPDIKKTVTPDFKCPRGKGHVLFVSIDGTHTRLGGTALAQCFGQIGHSAPDLEHPKVLRLAFEVTQKLIQESKLYAGHDVSDGGLITCLLEMAFSGNCGLNVDIKGVNGDPIELLFAEEVGWVLEVEESDVESIILSYVSVGATCRCVGHSGPVGCDAEVVIAFDGQTVLKNKMAALRDIWEETSFQLEKLQANPSCVHHEQTGLCKRKLPPYKLTFDCNSSPVTGKAKLPPQPGYIPRVAVLREEGINGDREMAAAFKMAGFEVWDVTMTDLANNKLTLDIFQGLVFPGGFSFADVLGSAKGWAASLLFSRDLCAQFDAFQNRLDTFSLGVCNGCQLMATLGWVSPDQSSMRSRGSCHKTRQNQGVLLAPNLSGRYESRFVTVKIDKSPSIMMHGMEGSVLGVWVAHGEGRFEFKNSKIYEGIRSRRLASLYYVNDNGSATTTYPQNPNGSPGGLAGICSENGRHLAMMPHPERCVLPWQWAWMPLEWKNSVKTSPWLRMFENAYTWCLKNHS